MNVQQVQQMGQGKRSNLSPIFQVHVININFIFEKVFHHFPAELSIKSFLGLNKLFNQFKQERYRQLSGKGIRRLNVYW